MLQQKPAEVWLGSLVAVVQPRLQLNSVGLVIPHLAVATNQECLTGVLAEVATHVHTTCTENVCSPYLEQYKNTCYV